MLYVTKLLRLFIQPLSLGLLLVVGGGVLTWWRSRLGLGLMGVGVAVLWVPATPLAADGMRGALEQQFPPRPASEAPSAEAVVVLGGSVGVRMPPREYPDLNDASDRVWHAARLYRVGKAPLVIASGGTLPWRDQTYREARAMQALLVSWGVPADSILMEAQSSSTYGNATKTAEVLEQSGIDHVLLVTSALHMRRALATFRAAGIQATPAATDYHVVERRYTVQALLPDAGALARSTAAIREYVGYIYYDLRGWIAVRSTLEPGANDAGLCPPHRPSMSCPWTSPSSTCATFG
jgi:uncharacterized SAM-binding protein YcdF (DUF218 family)